MFLTEKQCHHHNFKFNKFYIYIGLDISPSSANTSIPVIFNSKIQLEKLLLCFLVVMQVLSSIQSYPKI